MTFFRKLRRRARELSRTGQLQVERTRAERALAFLVLPAIVVSVLVLTGGSFRASFQLDKLREQAIVEASLELANARAALLEQFLIDQDSAVASEADVTKLANVSDAWLEVADRQTPTVRALLIIDLDSEARDVVVFASRAPGQSDDEFRQRFLHRIIRSLELDSEPREQLRHLHAPFSGEDYLLSYWQRRAGQRHYLIVAWHDIPRIVHEFLPSLYRGAITEHRMNIVDSHGRIIFGQPLSDGEFTVGRQFQTTLYKWRINVSLNAAEQLAANAERRLQLEIILAGLSALVVIAGSAVILVAASRERRLAQLKSEFVANVSHELKTPLSLIRMFGELLQAGVGDTEKRKKYADVIVTESERLGSLIENVLNFAKLERGVEAYEFTEGDLLALLRRVIAVARVRAEREGVTLDLTTEVDELYLRMDERAIEIAVSNLLDNALKYAAEGGWIGLEVAAPIGGHVNIVVRDRGPGIPVNDRERIFQRFARGEHRKRTRGTGIGLALVKSIAEAHGGSAWATPNERSEATQAAGGQPDAAETETGPLSQPLGTDGKITESRGAAFFLRLRVSSPAERAS